MAEKSNFLSNFEKKHKELYKFVMWCVSGGLSNIVELIVHVLLINLVFKSLAGDPVTGIFATFGNDKCTFYSYLILTTIGYGIAFVLNRKVSFKADANVALSTFLYVIMVVFTIAMNSFVIGPFCEGTVTEFFAQKDLNVLGTIVSKLIGMAVPGLWTYPCNRFIIHRKKKSTIEAEKAAEIAEQEAEKEKQAK